MAEKPQVAALNELGPKGVGFLFLCLLIVISGILACFGYAFGIVIGLLAIGCGILGIFSGLTKNLKGLLIVIPICILLIFFALINIFVLALDKREVIVTPYIGCIGLMFLPGPTAYLAYDGRGKSFNWGVV